MIRRAGFTKSVQLIWRLMLAVVFALGFGWVTTAAGSSISSADTTEHARYCKCNGCVPNSCCCGPRGPKVVEVGSPMSNGAAKGPCMRGTNCGDESLPSTTVPRPHDKIVLAVEMPYAPDRVGCPFTSDVSYILPAARSVLVEEPPESPVAP
jgi:hypothetical protein